MKDLMKSLYLTLAFIILFERKNRAPIQSAPRPTASDLRNAANVLEM
jgi:hypothetical protein